MKYIYVTLLVLSSICLFSDSREYIISTLDRNKIRILAATGFSLQKIKDPELYSQLRYLSDEDTTGKISLTSEGYFIFEVSRRLWQYFYTGGESGIIFTNFAYYDYDFFCNTNNFSYRNTV